MSATVTALDRPAAAPDDLDLDTEVDVEVSGDDDVAVPPLSPGLQLARGVLVTVAVLLLAFLLQLVVVSRLQHSAAQQRAFEHFRGQLATGTAPVGPADQDGDVLAEGTPVAYLEIPEIGLEQVVLEGTTPSTLYDGPGHRVDSVLPGQIGVSRIMGRRAAYGGPFGDLAQLEAGDAITVTTGQGTFEYAVLGVRREGDPVPPPLAAGSSRLTLVTANGTPFVPSGVVLVDADIVGQAVVGAPRIVPAASLAPAELPMGADRSSLWRLAMWLQALLLVSIASVWSWHRWHRAKTWVVFVPVLAVVGLATAGELTRHLPNLL
jgi:sortase A